jgi:hypothetical protein
MMMGAAKHIARIGARSVGVAVTAAATTVALTFTTASPDVTLSAESTALLLCGTTCPKFREADLDVIVDQFIAPTQSGQPITPVAVTAPGEAWPITGIMRLLGLAVGDPRIFGPGGGAWPDAPWWKLSGLFDLTGNQSVQAGAANLEAAITEYGDDHLVVYGLSQGAAAANVVRKGLAAQYTDATAPDIDFVLQGDVNVPNGGFYSRFPGLYIPILDWTFNGAQPTDTPFDTVVINRQYDGFGDFPLYPLNVISLLNAVLGIVYLHTYPFDVSLPAEDPIESPAYQGMSGRTSYYLFESPDLPLFGPLRTLGVPESLIDIVEPFFRVLVELGYDRSIPAWEPTPARLIPTLDPAKVAIDLVNAIREGVQNAATLVGLPPLPSTPAPDTIAAPTIEPDHAETSDQVAFSSTALPTDTEHSDATEPETEGEQPPTNTAPSTSDTTEKAEAKEDSASDPARPRRLVQDSLNATDAADPATTDESSITSEPAAASATEGDSSAGDPSRDDASDGDAGDSE